MSTAQQRAAEAIRGLNCFGYAGPFKGARMFESGWHWVARRGGRLVIHGLWVSREARGEGRGTRMLKGILHMADAHRVACVLCVQSFDRGGMGTDELRAWYERHGFKSRGPRSPYIMVREPITRASGAGARVAPVQGVQRA